MADSTDDDSISEGTLTRIQERVLMAEKEKLNLDLPRGINDDLQQIIEEEVH